MKNALADTMSTLPQQLVRSLTWDRGRRRNAAATTRIEGTECKFGFGRVQMSNSSARSRIRSSIAVV